MRTITETSVPHSGHAEDDLSLLGFAQNDGVHVLERDLDRTVDGTGDCELHVLASLRARRPSPRIVARSTVHVRGPTSRIPQETRQLLRCPGGTLPVVPAQDDQPRACQPPRVAHVHARRSTRHPDLPGLRTRRGRLRHNRHEHRFLRHTGGDLLRDRLRRGRTAHRPFAHGSG